MSDQTETLVGRHEGALRNSAQPSEGGGGVGLWESETRGGRFRIESRRSLGSGECVKQYSDSVVCRRSGMFALYSHG